MKRSMRTLAVLLCCGVLLATVALAAGTYTKTLTAYYRDIKLSINGSLVVPKDVNGNVVDPFIVDGTTYLPVRAVAEALGENVDWEGESATVLVTDPAPGIEGTWKAVKTSQEGVDTAVETSFPKGYSVTLNAGGTGSTLIAGEPYDITWKEDNGALTIAYADDYCWYGTVSGDVMVLNIEGMFVTLTK